MQDDAEQFLVRLELGRLNILQSDLLELLITQPQDKVLSYYIILLLVHLTELPDTSNKNYLEILTILRSYKQSFLRKDVMRTLMEHVASCLGVTTEGVTLSASSKAHASMVEVIVVLIRNIL
jgi:hypothetical protein